jgi:hypothetical protein
MGQGSAPSHGLNDGVQLLRPVALKVLRWYYTDSRERKSWFVGAMIALGRLGRKSYP